MDHPTILKFIDGIRGVHKGRDCLYEQFVRGDHSSVKWRKYVATYVRIRRIVESYNETKHYRVVYLKGLSHNFLMERWRAGWLYISPPKSSWPYKYELWTGVGNFDVL